MTTSILSDTFMFTNGNKTVHVTHIFLCRNYKLHKFAQNKHFLVPRTPDVTVMIKFTIKMSFN